MDVYKARCDGFGMHSIVVDGHDVEEITKALNEAKATKGKPTALILKTYKGKGDRGGEKERRVREGRERKEEERRVREREEGRKREG